MWRDEERRRLEDVQAEVVDAGVLRPVGEGEAENRRWIACDVASMTEGSFQLEVEPDTLDFEAQQQWVSRFGGFYLLPSLAPRDLFGRRYWLLDGDQPVGTALLELSTLGGAWQRLSSLYVLPAARKKGVAGRALDAIARAAVHHGLAGLRLATSWTWQKSLRFYLARGFWVMMWKHDLQLLLEPGGPEWRFEVEGDTARLDVLIGGQRVPACAATRDGDALMPGPIALDSGLHVQVRHQALTTFATLLAVRGWPLVRTEAEWAKRYWWSDAGEPEGLAYKIGVFERIARDQGFVVDTPRIPSLGRWQTWAKGEGHGRRAQQIEDIELVLRARGLPLGEAEKEELEKVEDLFSLDNLLRAAATASSLEAWWAAQR